MLQSRLYLITVTSRRVTPTALPVTAVASYVFRALMSSSASQRHLSRNAPCSTKTKGVTSTQVYRSEEDDSTVFEYFLAIPDCGYYERLHRLPTTPPYGQRGDRYPCFCAYDSRHRRTPTILAARESCQGRIDAALARGLLLYYSINCYCGSNYSIVPVLIHETRAGLPPRAQH